jgi:NAD(P)H-dependent FMN reductase
MASKILLEGRGAVIKTRIVAFFERLNQALKQALSSPVVERLEFGQSQTQALMADWRPRSLFACVARSKNGAMNYFILSGSHRHNSQSSKVSKYFEKAIKRLDASSQTDFLDLAGNPVPLWDEGLWSADPKWTELWTPIKTRLEAADALVVVTPEWGGMSAPGVRNFLLLCSGGPVSHKPGLIVSVSASRNGAYPVSELRANTTKNNQLNWIPEHIIVRDCESMLNGEQATEEADLYLRGRIDYSIKLLGEYAKALSLIRSSGVIDTKNYRFGM